MVWDLYLSLKILLPSFVTKKKDRRMCLAIGGLDVLSYSWIASRRGE